jgi:Tol biopolymer transport system component
MNGKTRSYVKIVAGFFGALLAAGVMALAGYGEPARAAHPGSTGAIAFTSERGQGFGVYRMNADGFGQTRISDLPGLSFSPSWSPDGKRIVFHNLADFGIPAEVHAMNADGSGRVNLTNAASDEGSASFGPSGDTVAFASNRADDQYDVYIMKLSSNGQTTGLTRLTTDPGQDSGAAISPDGKRILFVSDRDGDEDIYLMKLAPEGPRNVPIKLTKNTQAEPDRPPFMNDLSPDWSPDGRQIVFYSDRNGNAEVYRMKAAPESSTNRPVNLSRSPGSSDSDPVYSPDGKKVAFTTNRDGNSEIYRMRATDGANPTNLTNNPSVDFFPTWQPLP